MFKLKPIIFLAFVSMSSISLTMILSQKVFKPTITKSHAYSIGHKLSKSHGNHELSVEEACKETKNCLKKAIIKGVREPDTQSLVPWEMGIQRVFSRDGKTRSVSADRAVIQHIHGNPLPNLIQKRSSALKRGYKEIKLIDTFPDRVKPLIGNNSRDDLWASVTMRQFRNKVLAQSASWLCVGVAHPNRNQQWRKFGNFAHMIGDTYSASHTLRLPEPKTPLMMSFSMDTVMWKKHVVGDANHTDFRFKALVAELKELAQLYSQALTQVSSLKLKEKKHTQQVNQLLKPIFDRLCDHVLVMDKQTLNRPAGGSTFEWSASMNQNKAMLPSGLSNEQDLQTYLSELRKEHKDYFYPKRMAADFCQERAILSCDWKLEIKPALKRSNRVKTMFVPQIDRSMHPQK